MDENEQDDIAPEDSGGGVPVSHVKGRKAFNNLRRELTDEELTSPAVQRMLIDEIERLEKENNELNQYQVNYHKADKKAAVLEGKLKEKVAVEVIFGVCLTVGAGLIGLAPSIWKPDSPHGWISLVLGGILIIGGIASKVVKR